jgi:hypothetical protein
VSGPQGGYHIFTSVRFRGFDVASIRVEVSARAAETDDYLGPGNIGLPRSDDPVDGWYESIGILNFINDPDPVRGREVVLRSVVSDDSGAAAADERIVIAQ